MITFRLGSYVDLDSLSDVITALQQYFIVNFYFQDRYIKTVLILMFFFFCFIMFLV